MDWRWLFMLSLFCPFGIAGCAGMTHTGRGALVGSGLGAASGALVGSATGNPKAGALIGATAGALGGALVGQTREAREERDWALSQAASAQTQLAAAQHALTNNDVILMAQHGLAPSVIVTSIQQQGGRFSTTPQDLVWLKQHGVADDVILAMQRTPQLPMQLAPPGPSDRDVLVLEPPTSVFVNGPRRYLPPRYRRWRPRRVGPSFSISVHN